MNYCEHHLGDYAKRTGAFTMLEHGAYAKLRDRYFVTEAPIPAADVYRQAGARSKDERAAVEVVLAEFYWLDRDVWRCDQFDAEVEKAQAKIKAAQENGKRGGRPKRTKTEPGGNPPGFDSVTQVKAHHTPDTNHQTPEEQHTRTASSTEPGRVCLAMRRAGISDTNPGHPDLLALIDAGAVDAEFAGAARSAVDRGKGFAYALGTLKRQRAEAKSTAAGLHRGPMPAAETPTQRAQRERAAAFAPSVAAKAPGGNPFTIDAEVTDVTPRLVG